MDPDIRITDHAFDRIKERLGLSKKAAQRIALKAYAEGIQHEQTTGALRRYLDKIYISHGKSSGTRIYGEHLWLFREQTLLTVLYLPTELKRSAKSLL